MKRVEGFKRYFICKDGTIFKQKRDFSLNKLNPSKCRKGYSFITIKDDNGKLKGRRIHRLVALAFIPNRFPETKQCIDHIDGDKSNNNVSNLRWVSVEENNYFYREKIGLSTKGKSLTADLITNLRKQGYSFKEIGTAFGLSRQGVQQKAQKLNIQLKKFKKLPIEIYLKQTKET